MYSVLVVEDERSIREAVYAWLEAAGHRALQAPDGRTALNLAREEMPDLVILDWMLPDIAGDQILAQIRKNSDVPVIMLTARTEEADRLAGFSAGADDYVCKPFSLPELMARAEVILRRRGKRTQDASELSFEGGNLRILTEAHRVMCMGREVALTPNEYAILLTLAQNPKKVFTREQLIRSAFPDDFDGFDRAVDSHVKNLRSKIEADTRTPRYVLTVYGVGYRWGAES